MRMAGHLLIVSLCLSACSSVGPQKASAERTLDSVDSRSVTALWRNDASDDAARDLAVSVGKMPGVESVDVSYASETIKVYLLSSATEEQTRQIRDYLLSSEIVMRVE